MLAAVLAIGQVGVLLHGLFHVVDRGGVSAAQVHDGDAHGEHSGERPCTAYDGLIGAAACGAAPNLLVPPQVAVTGARYYFRYTSVRVAFSARAPPAFLA